MNRADDDHDYDVVDESSNLNLLQVKRSFLESRGIRGSILDENFVTAEGINSGGIIRARLIVRGDQAAEARRLLAEFA